MRQQGSAEDYVIATGETGRLEDFRRARFGAAIRRCDSTLMRPADISNGLANPFNTLNCFGWQAKYRITEVVKLIVSAEQNAVKRKRISGTHTKDGLSTTDQARYCLQECIK